MGQMTLTMRSRPITTHFISPLLAARRRRSNRGKDRWQGLEQFLLEQHAKEGLAAS